MKGHYMINQETEINSLDFCYADFILGLAYCLSAIKVRCLEHDRLIIKEKRIRAAFLPEIFSIKRDAEIKSPREQRASRNWSFIRNGFSHPSFSIENDFDLRIKNSFFIETIPSVHMVLRPDAIPEAQKIYEEDPDLFANAAGMLIRAHLEHWDKKRFLSENDQIPGYGLLLVSDINP